MDRYILDRYILLVGSCSIDLSACRSPRLQLKSMVRDRTDLFDFSAAALVAGGLTSLALFVAGLAASHGGAAPEVRGGDSRMRQPGGVWLSTLPTPRVMHSR